MPANKNLALCVGMILVIGGIVGFFVNPLFGVIEMSILHNGFYVMTGLILMIGAAISDGADSPTYNKVLGIMYILLGIAGFYGALSFVQVTPGNNPANYLHVIIGVVLAEAGFFAKEEE